MEKINPFANQKRESKEADPTKMIFGDDEVRSFRIVSTPIPYEEVRIQEVNEKWPTTIIQKSDSFNVIYDYVQTLWIKWKEMKEELGGKEKAKASKEGKALLAEITAFSPKKKSAFLCIDRKDGKVKKLFANQTITKTIKLAYEDPEYGDPSDADHGYDFKNVTEGKRENRKYTVTASRKESPLTKEERKAVKDFGDFSLEFTSEKEFNRIVKNSKTPIVDPEKTEIKTEVRKKEVQNDDDPEGLVLDRPDAE